MAQPNFGSGSLGLGSGRSWSPQPARTDALRAAAASAEGVRNRRAAAGEDDAPALELSRYLLWLIPARAAVFFLGLNLAQPLGIVPERFFSLPFVPFFNLLCVTLTLAYLALWWNGRMLVLQLYLQIGLDFGLASLLVAHTRGFDSPFISFYLLIIIYCSLILGRRGALASAALSTTLYSCIVGAEHAGWTALHSGDVKVDTLAFRTSFHALSFLSVAFLGTYLSRRLQRVQALLEEKIDSLRQLQKLNDLIVSSIRSGLVTTDLGGEITLFNNTAEELTARNRTASLHRPVQSVFGEDFWDRIVAADLVHNARPLRHESWITLEAGERRFLGFSVSPLLDPQRQLIGYIIAFQDLTEIKQLEEEVRLKDRLATIGRMAAGIAHEIRNPLTSMRGSVEILRSHARLQKTEQRLLEIMLRESDRLNDFVEDLLCFARPGKYARQPMDLAALLRDSVTLLRNDPAVLDRHSIRLELETEPVVVMGNPDKLKQVFWNLARNALRAMPDGGMLAIRAGRDDDGSGKVIFKDDGVGIAPDEKNQMFQPFHSASANGTGLGLSIVFQILEDHGGSIRVDSEKDQGTAVTIRLPAPGHDRMTTR